MLYLRESLKGIMYDKVEGPSTMAQAQKGDCTVLYHITQPLSHQD